MDDTRYPHEVGVPTTIHHNSEIPQTYFNEFPNRSYLGKKETTSGATKNNMDDGHTYGFLGGKLNASQ